MTSPPARYSWFIPCALLVLTLLVYANSFPGTFVLDDLHIVQNNQLVQQPDLLTIFTSDYWHGFENSGLFRPITILSLAINRLLLGANPLGFHLVNVLLHAVVAVLLWRLLCEWGLPVAAASTAAVLFVVHPIHVEAIDIVVGRSELLVALFLLAAFLIARREGWIAWSAVWVCYLLALCSKEHAITFLALLPLVDLFHDGYSAIRRRWPLYVGLLIATIFWLSWRHYFVILNNPLPRFLLTEAANPLGFIDTTSRVLTALRYQGLYLGKMLLPHGLQSVYSSNDLPLFIRSVFSLSGMLVVTGSGAIVGLLVIGWRRRSLIALCGALYLIAFLPTANIVFPIGAAVAERLGYFPSVWYCASLGAILASLWEFERTKRWLWLVVIIYGLFLSVSLLVRNLDYADEISLWSAEVEENPSDFLGWQSLAESYNNQGQYEGADNAYRTMLALAPDYPGGLRSRTAFFLSLGMYDKALPSAEKVFALSQEKNDPIAQAFDGLDLAEVTLQLNDCGRTLTLLDGPALPLQNHLRALELRSVALACLNRHEEAVKYFSRIEGEPQDHRIRYRYGLSLFQLRRLADARTQLEEAVRRNDKDAEAWNLLGVVSAEQKDWTSGIAAMERASELAPDNQRYLENLERARREGGR